MAKVRGTQREMPLAFEICKNTVYERAQIKRIEVKATESELGFYGWEYEERRYTLAEWYEKDRMESKMAIAELAELITKGGCNG